MLRKGLESGCGGGARDGDSQGEGCVSRSEAGLCTHVTSCDLRMTEDTDANAGREAPGPKVTTVTPARSSS